MALMGFLGEPHLLSASEEPLNVPGFNERLNDFLSTEGGVQVYVDPDGNVGTIIDPPGGERRMTVQPPQSPSINLGPPLQLNNPLIHPPQGTDPAHSAPPDFPQKARDR